MFEWWGECCDCASSIYEDFLEEQYPFSLPSPLPQWPKGQDFGTGKICLGELEVVQITSFEKIWSCTPLLGKSNGVTFYKPVEIPNGYFTLGHHCQPTDRKSSGYLLVAKSISTVDSPPLQKPLSYSLIFTSKSRKNGSGYIWLPNPPTGYISAGFIVTNEPNEPDLEEVRCVRSDLTESCEVDEIIFDRNSLFSKSRFYVWNTRPCERGMLCKGVPIGTFFCSTDKSDEDNNLSIGCLKNIDSSYAAMPNVDQIHALVQHYGPTIYFHPDEAYFPSSVSWFFKNGALLYKEDDGDNNNNNNNNGLAIDSNGSNLPCGGKNDGEFWLDLPKEDEKRDYVKRGNIETAEVYVHVKPSSGGTFTDISMWIFCPFNGPSTIKAGPLDYAFDKIGQHVGDWEHYTLRLSNFNGELFRVYFSEHSGGEWVDASELEFINGNKFIVYASKSGHASFPHEGCYIQGSEKLGIGARNDCAKSEYSVDSSRKYCVVAAEYIGDGITEPRWLQYMREWGPTVVYKSGSEIDKIMKNLPFFVRFSLENLVELFPTEIYGEEGPTGPKEKDNWLGDERC